MSDTRFTISLCIAVPLPHLNTLRGLRDCDEFETQAVTVSKTNFTASFSSISHYSSSINIRTFLSSVTLIHIHSMSSKANIVILAVS